MRLIEYCGPVASDNVRTMDRFRGGGKKTLTPEYREFKESLQLLTQAQWSGPKARGRISLSILARIPRDMDVQNLIKPLCDALEAAGVFETSDNQVGGLTLIESAKHTEKPGVGILVIQVEWSGNERKMPAEYEGRLDGMMRRAYGAGVRP